MLSAPQTEYILPPLYWDMEAEISKADDHFFIHTALFNNMKSTSALQD